ncbi:MAG: hypothetical protein QXI16_01510 [Sulfolobaceae archaeon]
MAGLPAPKVKWYNEANTMEVTEWNAGVVDAGSYSRPDDPTIPDDPNFPSTFLIWNNRYDPVSNPTGNTKDVSDMLNVTITTLSLVRDANGNIDPNLSYQPTGGVADKTQAVVQVIFFDSSKNNGQGEWGTYDSNNVWRPNTWREIGGNDKCPVVVCAGSAGNPPAYNTISGKANTGNVNVDKQNYAKVKMRLYVKPTALAGKIEWITRVSYTYEG